MKKNIKTKILLLTFISLSLFTFGQVGINTANPQGTFHVDGAKDNAASGIPTAAQQSNDFVIFPNGNTAIGTTSMSVAKLNIKGNMILGSAASTNGARGYSVVVRDNVTGELKVMSTPTSAAPISYMVYQLDNVNQDFVGDFNTNIDTTKYTLALIGSSFSSNDGTNQLKMSLPTSGDFAPLNINSYKSGGTWHIFADFPSAGTNNATNGSWTVYCLVINNSITKDLGTITTDLGGSEIGSGVVPGL
ncbi:hypothetical protein HNP24_004363 [Chryseobacterium sediminis]|uniref:Uncharacterized protein n=1 Tax=Chryseobacterium sediminis TaxID=1679494 RepID=A0ABR6Q6H4_9FLAO|nr:hypothetical protein [Chryseobacterium sediminis]MBB6333337.1 hypothetical protein [Chryseobacterium sediminis]